MTADCLIDFFSYKLVLCFGDFRYIWLFFLFDVCLICWKNENF